MTSKTGKKRGGKSPAKPKRPLVPTSPPEARPPIKLPPPPPGYKGGKNQ